MDSICPMIRGAYSGAKKSGPHVFFLATRVTTLSVLVECFGGEQPWNKDSLRLPLLWEVPEAPSGAQKR